VDVFRIHHVELSYENGIPHATVPQTSDAVPTFDDSLNGIDPLRWEGF
tara:strand:+ start:4837 stop:4980 length:144 start_codon:yes stop_codon:yes gene_type:complete